MGRRTTAQKVSYARAEDRAVRLADRVAWTGDQRDAVTAIKRDDVRHRWNQRHHAANRAGERFGVVVDVGLFAEIGARIATGERVQPGLILIGHVIRDWKARRTSAWLVWIDGQAMPVIYDHDTRAVVTVLPWNAFPLTFERGVFLDLANGGTKAARSVWREVRP